MRRRDLLRTHPPALYGAADPKGGAVESGVRFFAQPTCHHVPEVYSAVGENESAGLLKEFFRVRR